MIQTKPHRIFLSVAVVILFVAAVCKYQRDQTRQKVRFEQTLQALPEITGSATSN